MTHWWLLKIYLLCSRCVRVWGCLLDSRCVLCNHGGQAHALPACRYSSAAALARRLMLSCSWPSSASSCPDFACVHTMQSSSCPCSSQRSADSRVQDTLLQSHGARLRLQHGLVQPHGQQSIARVYLQLQVHPCRSCSHALEAGQQLQPRAWPAGVPCQLLNTRSCLQSLTISSGISC